MSLLKRQDWTKLRNEYRVAFSGMHPSLFKKMLDKVYGNPGSDSSNPGELDETDAMMIYLSHAEPPIPPAKI